MLKLQNKNLSLVRLITALCALVLCVVSSKAATYFVTNTNNTGAGSLRSAIAAANGTNTDDTIGFNIQQNDAGCNTAGICTITLTTGELAVDSVSTAGKLTLTNSTGANKLLISGNNASRVFFTRTNSDFTVNGVTITGGNGTGTTDPNSDYFGGGIFNDYGILTINNAIIGNNVIPYSATTASNGGGVFNSNGTLTINNSTINNNTADYGGGIGNGIGDSSNNIVSKVTVSNSTVSNNTALEADAGGGIDNSNELNLINVTVTGNRATETSAGAKGGGIWSDQTNSVANLLNTIVAGNTVGNAAAAPDFKGAISASSSYNLIGNNQLTTGISNGINNNQVGTNASPLDAMLAPLGNYGGATPTHALLSASPAVNAGTASGAPATDQRGATRIGATDIGAFELNNTANGGIFVANLPNATPNNNYNVLITADSGTFTYSVTSGTLPNGITLTTSFAPQAVVALTGSPTQSGTFNFSITATNGTSSNVTNYRLQVLSTTAAAVSIAGRVLTAEGRGLRNAIVVLTNENGTVITARTGSFGYYRFDEIAVGANYVLEVRSKQYQFAPQVLFVTEAAENLNFVALP